MERRDQTAPSDAPALPRLAVFYHDRAFSTLEIIEAAAGVCRIIWVIGWSEQPLTFPVRGLARLGEVVDVTGQSTDGVIKTLRTVAPDGIVTFTEPPMVLAAAVGKALGLRYHQPETALRLCDKLAQRHALGAAGVPGPSITTFLPSEVLSSAINPLLKVRPPAVLKPRFGAGGRDTYFIEQSDELSTFLRRCPEEPFVLETFLADRNPPASSVGADMVSVESVVEDGVIHHIALTGRFTLDLAFREAGHFLPCDLSPGDREATLAMATDAARALGLAFGILHTELKITPEGPRIIEVNGRVGGGIPELLERLGGPPIVTWAMAQALGLGIDLSGLDPDGPLLMGDHPVAFCYWMGPPEHATVVRSVDGIAEARALDDVTRVNLVRRAGDAVSAQAGGMFGYVAEVSGLTDSHDTLTRLIDRIDATLLIGYGF